MSDIKSDSDRRKLERQQIKATRELERQKIKDRRAFIRQRKLKSEFFRSVPNFKLTNSVFMFILLLVCVSGIRSFQSDLRNQNYEPKSNYVDNFVELSTTAGDGLMDGFKTITVTLTDIFKFVYKVGRVLKILPEMELDNQYNTDWMDKTVDDITDPLTPMDEIFDFLKDAWTWAKGVFNDFIGKE